MALGKDFAPAHLWLGRTYQEVGRYRAALEAFARVHALVGDWPVSLAAHAFVAAASGQRAEATLGLDRLEALRASRYVTPYALALVHAALGQTDEAYARLDNAFDDRSNWLVWLRLDPRWKTLHGDRRFAERVARLNFPPPLNRR